MTAWLNPKKGHKKPRPEGRANDFFKLQIPYLLSGTIPPKVSFDSTMHTSLHCYCNDISMISDAHFDIGDSIIAVNNPSIDMVIVGYEGKKIRCAWVEESGEIKEDLFARTQLDDDKPAYSLERP